MSHIPIEAWLMLLIAMPGSVYGLWVLGQTPPGSLDPTVLSEMTVLFVDTELTFREELHLARALHGLPRDQIWHAFWRFVVPAFGPSLLAGRSGPYQVAEVCSRFETQTQRDRFLGAAFFWWTGVLTISSLRSALRTDVYDAFDDWQPSSGDDASSNQTPP